MSFHKINSIAPLPNYQLAAHFWDGTTKIYDLNPLFEKYPIFSSLKSATGNFSSVKVDEGGYGVSWSDEIDLSSEEIWQNGQIINTPFDGIISFADASAIWGLHESTLRKAVSYGKFTSGIDVCKYGKQWLISISAMRREYGSPAHKKEAPATK